MCLGTEISVVKHPGTTWEDKDKSTWAKAHIAKAWCGGQLLAWYSIKCIVTSNTISNQTGLVLYIVFRNTNQSRSLCACGTILGELGEGARVSEVKVGECEASIAVIRGVPRPVQTPVHHTHTHTHIQCALCHRAYEVLLSRMRC